MFDSSYLRIVEDNSLSVDIKYTSFIFSRTNPSPERLIYNYYLWIHLAEYLRYKVTPVSA